MRTVVRPGALLAAALLAVLLSGGPALAGQRVARTAVCAAASNGVVYIYGKALYNAQTITAKRGGTLTRAQVGINNPGSTNDVTMEIRTVGASGSPGSKVLARTTIAGATIPGGATTITGKFDRGPVLEPGARYALVLHSVTTVNKAYLLPVATGDPCPGGSRYYYDDDAGSWSASADLDVASYAVYVKRTR